MYYPSLQLGSGSDKKVLHLARQKSPKVKSHQIFLNMLVPQ